MAHLAPPPSTQASIVPAGWLLALVMLALFAAACGDSTVVPCLADVRLGGDGLSAGACGGSRKASQATVKPTAVAAGTFHTCARLENGAVKCWGNNDSGQLGNGTTTTSPAPVAVSGISTAAAVQAGSSHTCALLTDSAVRCWGHNFYGQLGNDTGGDGLLASSPVVVARLTGAKAVAAGFFHTCALLLDSTVRCWGVNADGQVGTGATTGSSACFLGSPCETSPVSVTGISTATAVTAGGFHACALLSHGPVRCWGRNALGQLGNGTFTGSPTPVLVSGISTATALAGGAEHTCALLADASVKCWGGNFDGELGNGTLTHSSVPVLVSGITNAVAIEAWETHNCARLQNGSVACWGKNNFGELGDGTARDASTPVLVSGISTATTVAPGAKHTCALLVDGTAQCWGSNSFGQLGRGTATNATTPVTVTGLTTATAVAAGGFHACARLADSRVTCWGLNVTGQLGTGDTRDASTPVLVSGISTATVVAAGTFHTCARLADSTVRCWGNNSFGELGTGTVAALSSLPVAVAGLTTATAVAAGGNHTCARLQTGVVQCWGDNSTGALGNGTLTDSSAPVPVSSITTATAVAAGETHTCALLTTGTVWCWGDNLFGQLGIETTTALASLPVAVSGLTTVTAIAAGGRHTCARLSDSMVKCWGIGRVGQLGNGTFGVAVASSTPVAVTGLATATAATAGGTHTCARISDSSIRCWGSNGFGQLGHGVATSVTTAGRVAGLTPAAAKAFRACLLTDSPAACISLIGITAGLPLPVTVIGLFIQIPR